MADPDWQADLARYPRRSFFKEQSLWAIAVYRFGRRVDRRPPGWKRKVLEKLYWTAFHAVETLSGVSLPKSATIGPGLRIWHFGGIFLTHDAVLGANCTLRQGVTIGNRIDHGPSPILEDDVELGAYAQVLGRVHVGRGAKIGAMSVVLQDVPPGAVAVGIPARIIDRFAPGSETNPTDQPPALISQTNPTRGADPIDDETNPMPDRRSHCRPAVFLDRDGTVIENVPYLADPERVRPFPETIPALRRLQNAGFALVIVTNQSAIGRGLITLEQLASVNEAMTRQLAEQGVTLDGIYFCPEVPVKGDRTSVEHPDRKPGPGMLLRAAKDLDLDLATSWMIGDMLSDALAGVNAGCRGSILVETGHGLTDHAAHLRDGHRIAANLEEAADLILDTASPRETNPIGTAT